MKKNRLFAILLILASIASLSSLDAMHKRRRVPLRRLPKPVPTRVLPQKKCRECYYPDFGDYCCSEEPSAPSEPFKMKRTALDLEPDKKIHYVYKSEECAICLEEFNNDHEVYIFSCGHVFCKKCSRNVLAKGASAISCPMCRNEIIGCTRFGNLKEKKGRVSRTNTSDSDSSFSLANSSDDDIPDDFYNNTFDFDNDNYDENKRMFSNDDMDKLKRECEKEFEEYNGLADVLNKDSWELIDESIQNQILFRMSQCEHSLRRKYRKVAEEHSGLTEKFSRQFSFVNIDYKTKKDVVLYQIQLKEQMVDLESKLKMINKTK